MFWARGIIEYFWKIPWRWKWQPTLVLLLRKPHGPRSLAGSSPWGCKESDMTEHAPTHPHTKRNNHPGSRGFHLGSSGLDLKHTAVRAASKMFLWRRKGPSKRNGRSDEQGGGEVQAKRTPRLSEGHLVIPTLKRFSTLHCEISPKYRSDGITCQF